MPFSKSCQYYQLEMYSNVGSNLLVFWWLAKI